MDPRKPGPFYYSHFKFPFEPFYIGKGIKNRALSHQRNALKNKRSTPLLNKIRKILSSFEEIPIRFLRKGLTDKAAQKLEIHVISKVGRKDLESGPLVNLTNGGEGHKGYIKTEADKQKLATSVSTSWKTRSKKSREASLANLIGDKTKSESVREKISTAVKDTFAAKSAKQKKLENKRRRKGIIEYHKNRTPEQKQAASDARRRSWITRKKSNGKKA